MNSKSILNLYQNQILNKIAQDSFISSQFYFTGGTALSEAYLQHRESDDLDFFTYHPFDVQSILARLTGWAKELGYTIQSEFIDPTHIYFLTFHDGFHLKVDFARYPYEQLSSPSQFRKNLKVDSLKDIAANKLITLTQRLEIKDFVDVYFLLQENSFWNIRADSMKKFTIEIDPYLFAGDCMSVLEFQFLPKMLKSLTLQQLQQFYRDLGKKLGKDSVA
ncbi:MAG: hypothetical protein COU64_00800 [Candidatus Pacebacteria bacterium CG10_big_fil_rev_8_21_14_0_10_40_26]|nr:MAG: hypothetical protein COU64_00800 [Candidatus Pacebacteria bacterium CG10_big_fil_rev_8_21_14_0_10_40_26]PIZ64850.1 MAG: hypothetical protein COY15_04305 [Candidatus Roizmanbacteria bacterium CG_4_10_14_0_2_um_filter_39_12]PJC54759.1 MAG: hypothetical protein CO028_00710 [Candidatus Levybacteria bacterium CG_4_9_14_0_2_um_filter_35_21]